MDGISVSGLCKRFGKTSVLKDVSFTVPRGKIVGLVGPNGSGKTTILRTMAGLSKQDAGTINYDGVSYQEISSPGRTVGVLLDASARHPGRTVLETFRGAGLLVGASRKRIQCVIEEMGLGAVDRRPFRALSLGMKQRVGLGVAILGEPRFLVLDEPVNGLDIDTLRWMRQFLLSFAARGGTVLVSSHLLRDLQTYADQVVAISEGTVVMDEAVASIRSSDENVVTTSQTQDFRNILQENAINWRRGSQAFDTVVETTAENVARLCLQHQILVTGLAPNREDGLENAYFEAVNANFKVRVRS